MTTIFIVCATIGGTLLICQLLLTVIGWGAHGFEIDGGGADGHFGDLSGDSDGGSIGGDADADGHAGDHGTAEDHGAHHGPAWAFKVLSFRALVAALTFFGLAGLAGEAADASPMSVLFVAIAAGAGAMYGVYWMMQGLTQLHADGTVRIERALGKEGEVYLRIPASQAGTGKILMNLQNRTMEYCATTAGEEIPTGARVRVIGVVDPTTVEVAEVPVSERTTHA